MVGPQGQKIAVKSSDVAAMRQQNYALLSQPGTVRMTTPEGKPTYALRGEMDQFLASGHTMESHPDFYLDLDAAKEGKLKYHYPEGQKPYDENSSNAAVMMTSVDDKGNAYYKGMPVKAEYMSLAPPILPGGALANAGSKVASLFKGGESVSAVGTGILDESGNELTKEVVKQIPSMASKFTSGVAQHLVNNGMSYVKAATYATALEELLRRGIKDIFK